MLISNEEYKTYKIESIDAPLDIDYFWVLDLLEQDWMLTKLVMLEEFDTPSLVISIRGKLVELPADWNILVYSPETSDVDMVQISDLTKSNFTVFLYDFNKSKVIEEKCKVVNYSANSTIKTPSFNKNNMLCYPISDTYWIMVAPTDTYNKYLKDRVTVGNFLY